jgi:hypothetical protein
VTCQRGNFKVEGGTAGGLVTAMGKVWRRTCMGAAEGMELITHICTRGSATAGRLSRWSYWPLRRLGANNERTPCEHDLMTSNTSHISAYRFNANPKPVISIRTPKKEHLRATATSIVPTIRPPAPTHEQAPRVCSARQPVHHPWPSPRRQCPRRQCPRYRSPPPLKTRYSFARRP